MQNTKNLLTLVLTVFIDFLGFGIILPIIAPVVLDPSYGVLPAEIPTATRPLILGFLIGTYPLAQFFGAPILGTLSDKYGRKKILLVSIFGTALALTLTGTAIVTKKISLMFLGSLVNGFTGGNVSTAQSAIADMSDMSSKARNFGLIGMAFGLGFVLGPLIGGKLADRHIVSWFSYATPYWFAAGLAFLNVGLIWALFRETLQHQRSDVSLSFTTGFRNIKRAFSNVRIRVMFAVVFLAILGFTCFSQFFQVYLIREFQFTQGEIGELFAFLGIWIAITQGGITRYLSKHFTPHETLKVSIAALSLALMLLLVPTHTRWLFFILPLVAIAQGVTNPNATAIISNSVSSSEQGEILGINQSLVSIAMALTPVLAGLASTFDVKAPIVLSSAFSGLSWLVYMTLYKKPEEVAS